MIKHLASSSAGNAHLVDNILLDCGIKINELRMCVDLTHIEGCLLSHRHQDHSKAVEDILRAGVPVYSSEGTFNALGVSHHRSNIVKHGQNFTVGDWTVKPFDVVHDVEEPLGFLMAKNRHKILYLTDTSYSPFTFEGITHALVEADFSYKILEDNLEKDNVHYARKKRTIDNHMALEDVIEFLNSCDLSRLREIHLLHLSDENSDEDMFKKELQREFGVPIIVAEAN